ncbi:uncharacterized protein TA10125 [Theileria annulata]|uniref:Uncharacterized protein n=1 Tax=Theileria annulata TaxID=5874 RepID=Q4U8T3_THEAN|nr:uncharacterized protein TA10125 [Theileria annulata]CAI76770.1 hypothetical protein TA10125 [Theileria annulata]|eukprot:XP_953395.1 hypothetical protein TA10125 [Theileria annulata]
MFHGFITKNKKKHILERRVYEYLETCQCVKFTGILAKGENILNVSKNGDLILLTGKSWVILLSKEYDLLNPHISSSTFHGIYSFLDALSGSCCCDYNLIASSIAPQSRMSVKKLDYKTRCTSSLWYSDDNSIFLTSGDYKIDVWDADEFEIAYSFSDLSSLVSSVTLSNQNSAYPQIIAGLSCGSITLCDTRHASASIFCKPSFSSPLTCIKSLKHNENQLIATYDNLLMLVWDLRRFNKPLHKITNADKCRNDPIIWGCTVNSSSQNSVTRVLHEKVSADFKYEDDLWNYIRDHGSAPKKSKSLSLPIRKNSFMDPTIKHRRVLSSDHSINYSRYLDDKLMNSVKYTNGDFNGIEKEYKNKQLKKRIELNLQHTPPNFAPDNSNSIKSQMVPDKRSEVCTDIQISDHDFNIYIAHKGGIIECYNSNTFKLLKTINVKEFDSSMSNGTTKSHDQKIKIQLMSEDSVLAFNNMDLVGFVNLRNDQLIKYILVESKDSPQRTGPNRANQRSFFHDIHFEMGIINELQRFTQNNMPNNHGEQEHRGNEEGNQLDGQDLIAQQEALIRNRHFERQRGNRRAATDAAITRGLSNYSREEIAKDMNIKDISTTPSIREIYVTNGCGQLFEIHTGTT